MLCDVLTNPKQGTTFRLDRSHLMNVPVDYDDDVERRRTHPYLLPEEDLYNLANGYSAKKHIITGVCWANHAFPIREPDQPEIADLVNPVSRHLTHIIPYLTRILSSMTQMILIRSQ